MNVPFELTFTRIGTRIFFHTLEYYPSSLAGAVSLQYIQAVNTVCQTNFYTKGCHNKWYYPWAVPSSFAADKAVTSENLLQSSGSFWNCLLRLIFRPKTQKLDSDSEAGKISSADDTGDEERGRAKKSSRSAFQCSEIALYSKHDGPATCKTNSHGLRLSKLYRSWQVEPKVY